MRPELRNLMLLVFLLQTVSSCQTTRQKLLSPKQNVATTIVESEPSTETTTVPTTATLQCGRFANNETVSEFNFTRLPWIALLEILRDDDQIRHCTAAILSDRYLLSAATCFESVNIRNARRNVIVQVPDGSSPGSFRRIRAQSVQLHNHYNRYSFNNDFAMINLSVTTALNLNSGNLQSLCLPRCSASCSTGSTAYLVGWNRPAASDTWSQKAIDFLIESSPPCSEREANQCYSWRDSRFCATANLTTLEGAMLGSPLIAIGDGSFAICGILSKVHPACDSAYSIFASVCDQMPWIRLRSEQFVAEPTHPPLDGVTIGITSLDGIIAINEMFAPQAWLVDGGA